MLLKLPDISSLHYKSKSQIARVQTEQWAAENLYCPSCGGRLKTCQANTKTKDFDCLVCGIPFQLKSQQHSIGMYIQGADYNTFLQTIRDRKQNPTLILLHYDAMYVMNVLLIHSDAITEECIKARTQLGIHARRAGWQGCTIALPRILRSARIPVVAFGHILNVDEVKRTWKYTSRILDIIMQLTGWQRTLVEYIDRLGDHFSLTDVYTFEQEFSSMYPRNTNIRPKIRQQLQFLRDKGILEFNGKGKYSRVW